MKSQIKYFILGLYLLIAFSPIVANAEVKKRWELEFTHKAPKTFTYVDPLGKRINYSYFTYTITNFTEENIPVILDICIKAERDNYYQDGIHPIIEDGIITAEEKLDGLPLGIRKDRIQELKQELKYLNCQELRNKGQIKPKETIIGLAIFDEINPRTKSFEIMVGGLINIVKYREKKEMEGTLEEKLRYEYECKILKISYLYAGDEFYAQFQKDTSILKKEWIIRNYGPIGSKDTIPLLIKSLEDENPIVRWVAWWLVHRMTDQNFDYNADLSPAENKEAIIRFQEWWAVNKENLVYNLLLNKFEVVIKDDPTK
jgi:hypothetical protein